MLRKNELDFLLCESGLLKTVMRLMNFKVFVFTYEHSFLLIFK